MPSTAERIFHHSRWIWPDNQSWDLTNGYALFRTAFDLVRIPARAPLFITADQSYHLYVNGGFVGRGPARGYQRSWPYDEIDVRRFLRKGRNHIAVRAYNPGGSNFQYLTQGYAGLLVAARWGRTAIRSDTTWKAIRQPNTRRDTVPVSLQLFPQEHIDLRDDATHGWLRPEFDDRSWPAPEARPWNSAPWFALEARGIPPLAEKEIAPAALVGVGEGDCDPAYPNTRDVVALRQTETRAHRPAKPAGSSVEVGAARKGRFRSYLYDFGKTVVGNLVLDVGGAAGGEIVDTHFTESIDAATLTPDQVIPAHCRMAFGGRAILRAGDNHHAFYHHYGFRYLMVTVREPTRPLSLDVRLRWTGYPLKRNGAFRSSDPDLIRIWETCAWTQQCCSLDAYVDTPWREQAQWWGDARVQAWNTFHLDGDARLFRRGIRQIAGQTTPDGVTYGHAPTMAHGCILPDFTLIWFLTLWDYYWQTGSTEPLDTHRDTLERALDYFRAHSDPATGLVTYDDRYWLFLDWAEVFKDGAPAVYNLWLLIALEKLAALHRAAGRPAAARSLAAWALRLRASLGRLVGRNGLLHDGFDRRGRRVPGQGIHGQTLALLARIDGIDTQAALDRSILPWIRDEADPKAAAPSAYWATYVFDLLIGRGHGAEVTTFIKRHWLKMADHGTTWETFAPRPADESLSHAWSAHPLYHLMRTIGGLTQTSVAWKTVRFAPVLFGDHGGATVPTPAGRITSRWKRRADGRIEASLSLPKGVTAEVDVPGVKESRMEGTRRWLIAAGTDRPA